MISYYVYSLCLQVGHLAGVVRGVCEKTGCTVVLDVGSGLVCAIMTVRPPSSIRVLLVY